MLDRTWRLVSGVVDLAKDAVGPGKKVEERDFGGDGGDGGGD